MLGGGVVSKVRLMSRCVRLFAPFFLFQFGHIVVDFELQKWSFHPWPVSNIDARGPFRQCGRLPMRDPIPVVRIRDNTPPPTPTNLILPLKEIFL